MRLKELFEDIHVIKDVWTKEEADDRVANTAFRLEDRWKKYPSKLQFPVENFEVVQVRNAGIIVDWEIGLRNKLNGQFAAILNADQTSIKVGKKKIAGKATSVASVNANYLGQGLMQKLYQYLSDNGEILFSSTDQSVGGKKLWQKFVQENNENTFLVLALFEHSFSFVQSRNSFGRLRNAEGMSPLEFYEKNKSKNGVAIIIKADYDKLIKLAYLKSSGSSNPSYFVTLPKGHPLINEFNSIAFRP